MPKSNFERFTIEVLNLKFKFLLTVTGSKLKVYWTILIAAS